jgi:hypothetical protein
MQNTIGSHAKKCYSCQVNKRQHHKYGKLPHKLAITDPCECVDLIGPYTFKGEDGTQIDFICVSMIDPATNWFEIVELPVSQLREHDIPTGTHGHKGLGIHKQQNEPFFDKTSATVGSLMNKTWFCHYPRSQYIVYDNGSEFKLHFKPLCDSYGLERKLISVKSLQVNTILERVHQTLMGMLCTADIDMTDTVSESDNTDFLTNAA